MKTIRDNLKRASVNMIILSLLCEGKMYGYEISQEIKKRSNNELDFRDASIYTILCRLNEMGYVTYEEKKAGQRLVRLYYCITEDGRNYLKELVKDYYYMISVIDKLVVNLEDEK